MVCHVDNLGHTGVFGLTSVGFGDIPGVFLELTFVYMGDNRGVKDKGTVWLVVLKLLHGTKNTISELTRPQIYNFYKIP